jgi:hypothetical protein
MKSSCHGINITIDFIIDVPFDFPAFEMCLMKNISLEKFSRRYMHEYQWRVIVE